MMQLIIELSCGMYVCTELLVWSQAVSFLNEKNGVSLSSIRKWILAKYPETKDKQKASFNSLTIEVRYQQHGNITLAWLVLSLPCFALSNMLLSCSRSSYHIFFSCLVLNRLDLSCLVLNRLLSSFLVLSCLAVSCLCLDLRCLAFPWHLACFLFVCLVLSCLVSCKYYSNMLI